MTSSPPKTGQERGAVLDLAAAHRGSTLFADGGFWARVAGLDAAHRDRADHLRQAQALPTPPPPGSQSPHSAGHRGAPSRRSNGNGTRAHLAKTLPGLVARTAQRLLACTLGMYLNTLLGRPPRAPRRIHGHAPTSISRATRSLRLQYHAARCARPSASESGRSTVVSPANSAPPRDTTRPRPP